MEKTKENGERTKVGIFNVFEVVTEIIGWLQIVASPFLIGIILGSIIYFPKPSTPRLLLAIVPISLGLVFGVIWANKKWKEKGTIFYLSQISATPELDEPNEEKHRPKTKNTKQEIE